MYSFFPPVPSSLSHRRHFEGVKAFLSFMSCVLLPNVQFCGYRTDEGDRCLSLKYIFKENYVVTIKHRRVGGGWPKLFNIDFRKKEDVAEAEGGSRNWGDILLEVSGDTGYRLTG